jgi:hypothetical protein
LWVFTSEKLTVYTIETSRSHEVVLDILGKEFKGILVSDCHLARIVLSAMTGWIGLAMTLPMLLLFSNWTANMLKPPAKNAMSIPEPLRICSLRRRIVSRAIKRMMSMKAGSGRIAPPVITPQIGVTQNLITTFRLSNSKANMPKFNNCMECHADGREHEGGGDD